MIDARGALGTHDVFFVTLDALRFDVAAAALARGRTPRLATLLPGGAWELRETPGNFTYAAHQAFFAGFLPTPAGPGRNERLFAVRFPGSETTTERTLVFDAPDIVHGFAAEGYSTICIGGVGFFNLRSPLGAVLPGLFAESHWGEELGVTSPRSTELQVDLAIQRLKALPRSQRAFLFLNVSAIHQPSRIFLPGAEEDSLATHEAALAYADAHIGRLVTFARERAPILLIICSDHGTAFGEGGRHGHRFNHDVVLNVPYAEALLSRIEAEDAA